MPTKPKKKVVTTLRLQPELLAKLNVEAIKERRSRTNLIEGVLRDFVFKRRKASTNDDVLA